MERLRSALSKLSWPRPPAALPFVSVIFEWERRPATHLDQAEMAEEEFNDLTPSEAMDLIARWTDDPPHETFFTVYIDGTPFEDEVGRAKLEDLIDKLSA